MERIKAPIDNKNLLEDPFEDEMFDSFYQAPDHRQGSRRHMIGFVQVRDDYNCVIEEGYVDARWFFGDNSVDITVVATPAVEDYVPARDAIFDYYEKEFKKWECEENEGLRVEFKRVLSILTVSFWYDCE